MANGMLGVRGRAVVVGLAVLAGCESAAPTQSSTTTQPTTDNTSKSTVAPKAPPEMVLSADESGLSGESLTTLKIAKTRDLWIRTKVTDASNVTGLKLLFINPRNEPFLEREFVFGTDKSVTLAKAPGGHDVDVHHVTPIAGGYALDASIPIGGSQIERYATEGTWTIRAEVLRGSQPSTVVVRTFEADLKL